MDSNVLTDWGQLNGGVPHGTKLGPVLFLCMINDLTLDLPTFKYVDDTSTVHITNSSEDNALQVAADSAAEWSASMNMQLNAKKTVEMVIDFNIPTHNLTPIMVNGEQIERVQSSTLLGLHISNDLKWHVHVNEMVKAAAKKLYLVSQLKRACVPPEDILTIFTSVIRPKLEYACPVWHSSVTEGDAILWNQFRKGH